MLESNTIRFTTDTFGASLAFVEEPIDGLPEDPDSPDIPEEQTFMKQAFLVSKVPLNCTKKTAVDQFVITGNEPTGSSRRVIFKIDDVLYKFKNGRLATYNDVGEFEDVIKYGNKVSVLNNLPNVNDFVGKKVYPIIAMQAPSNADDFPTIKIGLATRSTTEQLSDTQDSPIYELGDEAQTIVSIVPKINTTGAGEVSITVRLRKDNQWSVYMPLTDAVDREADALQFRMKYTVETASGTDSAQVESITVTHSLGRAVVTGNVANFYSTVANYEEDLKTAYCLVRHEPLVDAAIECYVNFMPEPKHRELITIGTANGNRQELTLGDPDPNIVATSIQLFQDGTPFYDFDFSTELSTVIFTAKKNSVITASYDYDTGTEIWRKMTPDNSQPYNDDDGTYSTRFTYINDEPNMKVANIRVRLRRLSGSASGKLGTATGKTQLFMLKHKPVPSSITFTQNIKHSYDEETGILSCVGAKGTAINISYNYLGDSPVVHSFAAGFAVA
ncbi:MAG: hypothetical protein IKD73_09480 [Selenomonadaceae bacterium]|nr:hypothetical protein [Selenomonadaceae bacterium]